MTKKLRDYQQIAVQECWEALKRDVRPVLLMSSVGSGKSLMLASILFSMQKMGKRALCLVNNAELVQNNCKTFINQGGEASIYCAALNSKDITKPVVFGTPQSILNGINKNEPIAAIRFNLIVVDEAHCINYLNHASVFMRILRHYRQEYSSMRVLGATGTNFRFKGAGIVGEDCLFKTQVGNITTESLIENDYLIKPIFEVDKNLVIDFSKVAIKKNGQFDQKQLQQVVDENTRLTKKICQQVVLIMESENRHGVFFFATTKKHAEEIMSYLPPLQSALILGETKQQERTRILNAARKGEIKYLVNIAIISVGVDVPAYDTIAYLRPTESLVLLVQTMGRVLRLSPETGKQDALVLDFAGNIERHRDWDNPIIQEAVAQTIDKDKPLVIVCPVCSELNTETARRCCGKVNNKRCEYYFEWRECPNKECNAQNDIASRHCRVCEAEIIDPNAKLQIETIRPNYKEVSVLQAKYMITGGYDKFRVRVSYFCCDVNDRPLSIYESYSPISEKARYVFYGQFIKKHCNESIDWFPYLDNRNKMEEMLQTVKTPLRLILKRNENGFVIKQKVFKNDEHTS